MPAITAILEHMKTKPKTTKQSPQKNLKPNLEINLMDLIGPPLPKTSKKTTKSKPAPDSPTPEPNKYWVKAEDIVPNPGQGIVLVISQSIAIGPTRLGDVMSFGFYGPDEQWHVLKEGNYGSNTDYVKALVTRWMPLPGWPTD